MHGPEDVAAKILKVAEMLRLENPEARVHFTNTVSQMLFELTGDYWAEAWKKGYESGMRRGREEHGD
jgi:hypothetical protein